MAVPAVVTHSISTPLALQAKAPSRVVSSMLLIASLGATIISHIPPLRFAGALALRAVTLLSHADSSKRGWAQETLIGKITRCAKVAGLIGGIMAIAAASPILIIASLVADTALQTIDLIRACEQRDWAKAGQHFSAIVINSLVIGAMIVGSWELMVAAAAVSALAVVILMMCKAPTSQKNRNIHYGIEVIYYGLQFISSIAGAVMIAEHFNTQPRTKFEVENKEDRPMEFHDKNGNLVATLAPGEKKTIFLDSTGDHNWRSEREYLVDNKIFGYPYVFYGKRNLLTYVSKPPMEPALFPTVPIGPAVPRPFFIPEGDVLAAYEDAQWTENIKKIIKLVEGGFPPEKVLDDIFSRQFYVMTKRHVTLLQAILKTKFNLRNHDRVLISLVGLIPHNMSRDFSKPLIEIIKMWIEANASAYYENISDLNTRLIEFNDTEKKILMSAGINVDTIRNSAKESAKAARKEQIKTKMVDSPDPLLDIIGEYEQRGQEFAPSQDR